MTSDFDGSGLERQQLEAELQASLAQAAHTQARLARLAHIKQSATQSGLPPLQTSFQSPPTSNPPGHDAHGKPLQVPPHSASMSFGDLDLDMDLGHPALYQQFQYGTPMQRVNTQPDPQHPVAVSSPVVQMARSKSSIPTANPFTGGGGAGRRSVRPVPAPQQGRMSVDGYQTSPTADMFSPHMDGFICLPNQQYGSPLGPVMEHGRMMGTMENPGDFLQRLHVDIPRSSPIVPIYGMHPSNDSYQHFASHDTPSSQCGSLSSGPTIDTPMTRTNSNVTSSPQRFPLKSFYSQPIFVDNPDFIFNPDQQDSPSKKRSAPDEDPLSMPSSPAGPYGSYPPAVMDRSTSTGSRLSSGPSQNMSRMAANMHRHKSLQSQAMQRSDSQLSGQSIIVAAQVPSQQGEKMMRTVSDNSDASVPEQSEPMARTDSARSTKSTQSQRERNKEALKRHNTHAQIQPLAPKPKIESGSPTSAPSESKAGSDGKVAMPRSSGYQRPKRPKISCDQCDEHPDGFRGEHELRRHKDLKHSKEFKRFVCRTPSQLGLASDLQPITPLEKCKHCTSNKEYGQYYNAAAHLRRAHFKEKPPRQSRSKNGNANDEPRQKRAGMGGGDWPPMSELKARWMEEIKSTKPFNDTTTISDVDEGAQDIDIFDGPVPPSYMDAHAGFDDMAVPFVGSNTTLQVQNNDVYTDAFSSDLNYTTSPMITADLDPNMMPSTGSANFVFNSPINPANGLGYYPHDLPNLGTHFQSPNNSISTATLTPFNSFGQNGSQFVQKSSQPTMNHLPQQHMFGDLGFDLVMSGEYEDASLRQS